MSEINITNLFCYENLDLEIPVGPVLVTGENSSGKTSLARILAALTCHDANPAHLAATSAKAYIRDGALEGAAEMDGVTWMPTSGLTVPTGQKPKAPPHAVGMVNFLSGKSKDDRAKLWEGLFLPKDPEPILRPVWTLPDNQLLSVLKTIVEAKKEGWEEARAIYHGQQLASKRRWEEITGQRYGAKKAAEWRPDDWDTDLDGQSEDDVRTAITEAQDALRMLGRKQAIAQDRIDRGVEVRDTELPALAKQIIELEALIVDAEAIVKQYTAEKRTAMEAQAIPSKTMGDKQSEANVLKKRIKALETGDPIPCPHCGEDLAVDAGQITVYKLGDIEGAQKLRDQMPGIREGYDAAKLEREEKQQEARVASESVLSSQADLQRLKTKLSESTGQRTVLIKQAKDADLEVTEGSDEAERSRLENIRDAALKRMEAFVAQRDALKAHNNVVEQSAITKLLSPTGARAVYMKTHMDKVRKSLASISTRSGWKPITITQQYECTSGGRPAPLIAANERLKVQSAMQMAVVMLDKTCEWLVIDAADSLRDGSWEGLVTIVNRLAAKREDLHIVVCATSTVAPEGWASIELQAV